ncbi:alpha/beta fold hydrolase [Kitasatospora sp. NPDC057542]|uniref:alpha/beta fold hydrolase n=1 Tax=Streptomycetaceae TaxID=2062 RepID=UPI001CCDC54E|nr:alpha/beta hydrolase [Streptomyces sp. LS1784]
MTEAHGTMTTGTVSVEGGRLSYEVAQGGSGPTLVLLHGGMLDRHSWDEQFARLAARGHHVVRYDARGHGHSSTVTGDYAHQDDLRALLAHLAVPRAVLVGLSLGARTALDAALAHPEYVAALVLTAPGVSGRPFTDPFVTHHAEQQIAALGTGGAAGVELFVEHFLRMWVDGPHRSPTEVDGALRERLRACATANVLRHAAGLGAGLPREVGAADRLGEVAVPTLVLTGDLDGSDILANAHAVAAAAPNARHRVLPGAAHMIPLECPDLFEHELDTFLAAL